MVTLVLCLILSLWVSAIAVLSVQNAAAVSIQFLWFRSVELPLGVILAFCVAIGLLIVAVAQLPWQGPRDNTREGDEMGE